MAEFRGRLVSTEEDRKIVEELIVDYACKNYMDDVVAAFSAKRGCTCFNDIKVPHLRVAMFTVHSIVQKENVANFETSLQLLRKVHLIAPNLVPIKKYIQLITGLKTKILINKLSQETFDYADVCAHLNRYFPKSELKTKGVSELESQINSYQLRFRRRLTRLMLSPSEREAYRNNDLDDNELGPTLMVSNKRLLRIYIDRLNRELPEPVIEQIIAEGPQSQIAQEFQDSQSDGIDQLLSKIFKGAPSQDALLSILKTCWEAEDATTEDMEISDNSRATAESGDTSSSDTFACLVSTEIHGRPSSSATKKSTNQDPFTPQHTVDKVKKTNHDGIPREKMLDDLLSASPKSAHQAQYDGWMNDKLSPPQFPDSADVVEGASCFMETSGEICGVRKTQTDSRRHDDSGTSSGQGIKPPVTCEKTQVDDQRVCRSRFGFQASETNDSKFGWASRRATPKSNESVANRELAHGCTTNRKGFTATGERFTSIREDFTLNGNGFTPLREGFESIGRGFKLIGKAFMPTSEGFAVIEKGINLIGEGSTSITDGFRSIAQGFTIIEEGVNPINKGLTLVRNGFTSIREGFKSIRDGFTSLREGLASISKEFAPASEDFAPLSEGFTVIREGIMSINKGFSPISGGLAPLSLGEGFTAIEDGFTAIEDGFTAIRESQGEKMAGGVAASNNILPMSKSLPVSRSRIYFSKNHPRAKPQKTGTPNNLKACLEQAQLQFTSSGTEETSQILKNYTRNECDVVYISPNYLTSDPSNTQVSKSSRESQQSTSDQSNCSLSILAGLPVGRSFPIVSRSMLGGMTSLEEEMRELTSVVHNPVVPDLQVYPVTKADNLVSLEPTQSGSSTKVVPETPPSEQADGRSALRQVSEHGNTDSNGENKGNHAGDYQSVSETEQTCRTTDVHDETTDVLNSIDAKEKHPVVMLTRLSQDSDAKKHLNCSEVCEDAGELSPGEDSLSDESFVSDSDDGTGSWSDSSSLPSVELRPDSEIPLVRRIPTLKRYLHTPPKKNVTEGLIQMRECTVRLYKMKPKDIRALTKDKKKRYKRLDFTPR